MRTRTLLVLAVACGVLILAAGAIQLLRLAGQEESVREVATGVPVEVGDLTVVVAGVREEGARVRVDVEWGGVADPDAAGAFRLVVPGQELVAAPDPDGGDVAACGASRVAPSRCELTFTLPDDAGTSRVLLYRRGDERVRWDLSGT